ncbi:type II toxin-antitoxin system antitoxin SocA domain-containing protein [Moritella sp.]|uniref:Panacea domain-containing protein n=1 Tax=Moritella sp. TaxID=78556 RepID=UPI001D67A982|nr:type II toxin-antitoxin system antitoxin SocA domain-containing protein [Moritella sp.]MCJ8350755.1 DUF4065 domain-containing protein [Moritella sp.]NQZ42012.1 SocA family protein [Moritella sp.]
MINHDVFAKALLQRANDSGLAVCNLKLQKLAYYCQGYHLAVHKAALFNAPVKAWQHGPVVTGIYHEYSHFGNCHITIPTGQDFTAGLTEQALQIMDFVITKFGQIGAWTLRNQTHQEQPWLSHYDADKREADKQEITQIELTDFFNMEVANMQDATFAKILDSIDDDYISMPDTVSNADEFCAWIKSL